MKLVDIISEADNSEFEWHQNLQHQRKVPSMQDKGIWLVDRKSRKRLAGPFKDNEAAMSFKKNRPDRIPADAAISM